jgi:hypothetical protein
MASMIRTYNHMDGALFCFYLIANIRGDKKNRVSMPIKLVMN